MYDLDSDAACSSAHNLWQMLEWESCSPQRCGPLHSRVSHRLRSTMAQTMLEIASIRQENRTVPLLAISLVDGYWQGLGFPDGTANEGGYQRTYCLTALAILYIVIRLSDQGSGAIDPETMVIVAYSMQFAFEHDDDLITGSSILEAADELVKTVPWNEARLYPANFIPVLISVHDEICCRLTGSNGTYGCTSSKQRKCQQKLMDEAIRIADLLWYDAALVQYSQHTPRASEIAISAVLIAINNVPLSSSKKPLDLQILRQTLTRITTACKGVLSAFVSGEDVQDGTRRELEETFHRIRKGILDQPPAPMQAVCQAYMVSPCPVQSSDDENDEPLSY